MKPVFFAKQSEFRMWLEKNHIKSTEIWVGFYRISSEKSSLTWSQSVDEALCFGWIDGIRKSIDKESYCIRFTPRNPKSNWSTINIKKAESLIHKGRMQEKGLEIYLKRQPDKSEVYSYENKPLQLPPDFEQKFKANQKAWNYFLKQSPSYQRTIFYWILSAKQLNTQLSRLNKIICESEQLKRHF